MVKLMRVIQSRTMREIDKYCIEHLGIRGILLMENASKAVFEEVEKKLIDIDGNIVTIVCGVGNNGGDGIAVGRYLYLKGYKVKIFIVGNLFNGSSDFKENLNILNNINAMDHNAIYINYIDESNINELGKSLEESDIVIDSIFGTGLKRAVEGIYLDVISMINNRDKYVISIDVPSGLNSDDGKVLGIAIKANMTVTLQLYKKGFINYEAFNYCGDIVVKDIGIPERVTEAIGEDVFLANGEWIRERLPLRNKISHKGSFGKILIIAGSKEYTGAAYFSSEGAVKSGGGLVTLSTSRDVREILQTKLSEAMVSEYEDEDKVTKLVEGSDVIAIGSGMGQNERTFNLLKKVLTKTDKPVVIDADGINVLKEYMPFIRNREGKTILTPHLGEFSRLTGLSIKEIEDNRVEIAEAFAREYNIILLLKGYNTIITDGKKTMINTTGNSAMASGGMGDVLTGIIASFIGQGMDCFEGTVCAAYIHGACGDELANDKYSVTASDILNEIPYILKSCEK